MPSFKPAYLIHGDDHGRLAERRSRLRELAERESGQHGIELFEGDSGTPDDVATALNAMTFAIGRRFLIVDGVERWKDRDLDGLLRAVAALAPDTTVAFFAREDGRLKASGKLAQAVLAAGGDVAAESGVKPWELPRWVQGEARRLQLNLTPDAGRALISGVGERQQRLLRELEKLAIYQDPVEGSGEIDSETVERLSAHSSQRRAWALADALLAADGPAAARVYLQLRQQGERLAGLLYLISTRVRQAHQVSLSLEQGLSPAQVKKSLRMGPKAADQLIADARRAGSQRLRAMVEGVADLELASRGGGPAGNEDTHALRAILALTR